MGIFVLVFFLACLFYFLNVLAYIYEITMLLHFMLLKHFMLYAYAVKCKCCVYCVQYIVYLKMHW